MGYSAEIILDSVSPKGARITTAVIETSRTALAEYNTHRKLCLSGDTLLEFDLPSGSGQWSRRPYTMRLDDFVNRWHFGARPRKSKPRSPKPLDLLIDNQTYSAHEICKLMGLANPSNLHKACREGMMESYKFKNAWYITGQAYKNYENRPDTNRNTIQGRLSNMKIRQLNELTGRIQNSVVTEAIFSGKKKLYRVSAKGYSVTGSIDHLILTTTGYVRIGDLVVGKSQVLVRLFGKLSQDLVDAKRFKHINGIWQSAWNRKVHLERLSRYGGCQECGSSERLEIHHVIPIHECLEKAQDPSNVLLLCGSCHDAKHTQQGWQGDTYLYGGGVLVDSVEFLGEGQTYDLSIAGEFPNFLANGVVVHNSRNSASSRAIPSKKFLEDVMNDPYIPTFTGAKKGMQGTDRSADEAWQAECTVHWLAMRDAAVEGVTKLNALGVHKQDANRPLEPYMWHKILVTATWDAWPNLFTLRCNSDVYLPFQRTCDAFWDALATSKPVERTHHIPFLREEDSQFNLADQQRISVARCARISYLTHNGVRDPQEDLRLYNQLATSGHWSAFEHVARAIGARLALPSGNFVGWIQYRKDIMNEFPECENDMEAVIRKLSLARPERTEQWEAMPTTPQWEWLQ
jgi:hypothetical protein